MDPTAFRKLVTRHREGDPHALEELLPAMYDQLRRIAARYLQDERSDHTLGPTAVVHEAYLRLAGSDAQWNDRTHFLAIAATVMRRVLVDYARERNRVRRGAGAPRVSLEEIPELAQDELASVADLDDALRRLQTFDPRKARTVELIYFGGMTYEEAAQVVGVSVVTVHRDLRLAKAWLERELAAGPG